MTWTNTGGTRCRRGPREKDNFEAACWGLRPTTRHYGCSTMTKSIVVIAVIKDFGQVKEGRTKTRWIDDVGEMKKTRIGERQMRQDIVDSSQLLFQTRSHKVTSLAAMVAHWLTSSHHLLFLHETGTSEDCFGSMHVHCVTVRDVTQSGHITGWPSFEMTIESFSMKHSTHHYYCCCNITCFPGLAND